MERAIEKPWRLHPFDCRATAQRPKLAGQSEGASMKNFGVSRNVTMVIAAGLFALSFGGLARAITDTVFQYTKAKTGYVSVGPMAFAPGDNSTANNYDIHHPDYIIAGDSCFVAGVSLPQGATLTGFASWVSSDTDSAYDIALWRANPATGDHTLISELESSDTSQTRVILNRTISPGAVATINNQHFNYGVSVCVQNSISKFYGSRISYTYTDAGD
jgi:hypothetical protein